MEIFLLTAFLFFAWQARSQGHNDFYVTNYDLHWSQLTLKTWWLWKKRWLMFQIPDSRIQQLLTIHYPLSIEKPVKYYAGINLTGYHPPPPRAPRGFCTEMCAQPQGFCKTENARGAGLKMTMSLGPGICINFLSNMKIVNTIIWA